MDRLIYASLSHTHNWYEVGMLKVPEKDLLPKWAEEHGYQFKLFTFTFVSRAVDSA